MAETCILARGLSNAHVQTIWPYIFRKTANLNRVRERFTTPDNDFFDVDWYGQGEKGIVILLHGLTGCSSSHYILGLQDVLAREGYTTAAMNFRACSGEPNLKAGSYHAGFTQDIQQLYQQIRDKNPTTPVFTVGFSLGGNIMLKWLAERAGDIRISGAVAISVPYKLANCADKVDIDLAKIYRSHLIGHMKKKLDNKRKFFKDNKLNIELEKLNSLGDLNWVKSFWQFDNHVVAQLHGFADVLDYYQQSSAINYLKAIQTNTLLIHALDDPLMTPSVLPDKNQLSETTDLLLTPKGGHVGFLSKTQTGEIEFWLQSVVLNYLEKN